MKITFLIQDLFQQGAEYVTALMIRGFVKKGYKVDLLLSKVHSDLLHEGNKPFDIPKGVNVIIMSSRKARYNIRFLYKYIKSTDSKAIIAMCPNYLSALALAGIGHRNVKLGYVEHGGLSYGQLSIDDVKQPRKFSIGWMLGKLISREIDVFMAVSSGNAKIVEKIYGLPAGTVKAVYNPVVDETFKIKLSQPTVTHQLINKTIKTVAAAGAFCEFKDHINLFRAIKLANETMPVRLILFGKGYLEDSYRQWIADNKMSDLICLAGHTDNLPAEIKSADLFICSSTIESFSVVIIEALASGTPVLSTRCNYGPPEILGDGKYGKLVSVGDSKSMAATIIEILSKEKQKVPDEAWNRFEVDKIVENYELALNLKNQKSL